MQARGHEVRKRVGVAGEDLEVETGLGDLDVWWLASYGGGLAEKPELLVLNKSDAMTPRETSARMRALSKASGQPVALMSGVTGQGVPEILRALMDKVHAARREVAETVVA